MSNVLEYRVTYVEGGDLKWEACGLSLATARKARDVRVWCRPAPAHWELYEGVSGRIEEAV